MRAAVGYRAPEHDRSSLPSGGSLWAEEKNFHASLPGSSGSQEKEDADKCSSGRGGQVQSQSALQVLQQQLKSFQALRQQTLQDANMVQSEISEILNSKSPEFNPDNLCLMSTPVNIAMPRKFQGASHYNKQIHMDNNSSTSECPDTIFNTVCGNSAAGENIPYQASLKYKATENHLSISNNPVLSNDYKLKNLLSSSFIDLETRAVSPLNEIKHHSVPQVSMTCHKKETEETMSYSFKDMEEQGKKTSSHELSYMFNLQNSPSILCGKDNDSGYLSEQDLTEKGKDMSNEEFKCRRTLEMENSVNELQLVMAASKDNYQSVAQNESKQLLNVWPKAVKDQLIFSECQEERQIDRQRFSLSHKFQNCEDLESHDARDDSTNVKSLQMSAKESDHIHKQVMVLITENADLKNQIRPLSDKIQSLTKQNSKYQKEIKDLQEEKNGIQEKLAKADGDCRECIKEVKRLVKKCKELQQQKTALEQRQNQLNVEKQCMMQNIKDLERKDKETQESLISLTQEKNDLILSLQNLEKEISAFQEDNKKSREKIYELTDTKTLLEMGAQEKQNEIQQLKENEKVALSNQEVAFRMIQVLKDDKLKLDKTLQGALNAKEVLQEELGRAQYARAVAEGKFLTECKNAKLEIGALKTNLSNMEKECERLGKVIEEMTNGNWVLKKELHEHKQEASECKNKIRQLNEELLLTENKVRSMENERDTLRFEASRLLRHNTKLRSQVSSIFSEKYKQRHCSRCQSHSDRSESSTEICEEISSYQHISLIHNLPAYGKIVDIQKKSEAEHYTEKKQSVKKFYSALSVSCTTSTVKEASFPTARRKKYSLFCSAT